MQSAAHSTMRIRQLWWRNPTGTIVLAADMDGEILDKAVRKWIANNPRKFEAVRSKLNPKMMNYMVN